MVRDELSGVVDCRAVEAHCVEFPQVWPVCSVDDQSEVRGQRHRDASAVAESNSRAVASPADRHLAGLVRGDVPHAHDVVADDELVSGGPVKMPAPGTVLEPVGYVAVDFAGIDLIVAACEPGKQD